MENDLLLKLQDIYSRTLLIPVVGSGLSVPFGLPDWRTLIEQSAVHFHLDEKRQQQIREKLDVYEFLDAVDVVLEHGVSEQELQEFVVSCIVMAKEKADNQVCNNYLDLAKMSKVRFVTTNYDRYINDFTGAKSFSLSDLETIPINEFPLKGFDGTVIPLHGEITRADSIVLSRNSYKALYESDEFEREFQHLRTHFTFLFMGFSFDDAYFQKMFRKMLRRFEATHYILFEKRMEIECSDKIRKLSEEYGVKAIYYDAENLGHTRAISQTLEQIFCFKDSSVDMTEFAVLPDKRRIEMSEAEQKIIDQGREGISQEKLSKVYDLYWREYDSAAFRKHSVSFQVEILAGLIWYYGFKRQEERAEQLVQEALTDTGLKEQADKFAYLYGQILWNLRKYTECLDMLEKYRGEKEALSSLLYDMVKCFKNFLPEADDRQGMIPVYDTVERSQEEKRRYRTEYLKFRDHYVNPDTYNLLNLERYQDKDSQQIAYYWLGVTAGQLFHEHEDAIQYLLRSYELSPRLVVCEELAHNYLAKAENDIRYSAHPKTYELDVNSLLKAQIRFQYVMNSQDEAALKSFYERSGLAYLRTLYLMKNYFEFEDFYEKSHEFIPECEDLYLLKAEVDAAYECRVEKSILDHLSVENQQYITYCCAYYRAQMSATFAPQKSIFVYRAILDRADQEKEPIQDRRIWQILFDCAFFGKDIVHYETYKQSSTNEMICDMEQVGFEDELYGRFGEAEIKYRKTFEEHLDHGSFQILRGFYMRSNMRTEYRALYEQVLDFPPNEMFQQPRFYMDYILQEVEHWKDIWSAMRLYAKFSDKLETDLVLKKEVEEILKIYGADYGNYEDRIAWNRYIMAKAPKHAKQGIYLSILKLYVANLKYRQADEVVVEMKKEGLQIPERFDQLIKVCMKKQSSRYYTHIRPHFSSAKLEQFYGQLVGNWRFFTPYFAAKDMEIVIPIKVLLYMFYKNRQKELEAFSCIHIMYAGVINLQNSLWAGEDSFLRMVLQWIGDSHQVKLEAPEFQHLCEYAPDAYNRNHMAEDIQLKLFCQEHPEMIRV